MKGLSTFTNVFKVTAIAATCSLVTQFAVAAPVKGADDISFYVPSPVATNGIKGDLISYRSAQVDLGTSTADAKAWTLMYRSTDALGKANVVTGTMLVPNTPWAGSGQRPVVSYAVGTHGLDQRCAPSIQLTEGKDYENKNISAALAAGFTVLVSDYAGYTTGSTPTYLAGISQGQAVLDIIKAAQQLPGAATSASAPAGVWGYSQGGQSAAWAAQIQSTYAPEVKLLGVAAGGVPGNFNETAQYLNGNIGSSFLLQGVIGLAEQYPTQIPLNTLASAQGQQLIAQAKDQCVFESLFDFQSKRLSEFTVGAKDLNQILAENPSVQAVLDAQTLGNKRFNAPMYQYHGQADEFIPLSQAYDLKNNYCRAGNSVTFDLFPSEHIVTQFQGATNALSFLGARFKGERFTDSCGLFPIKPAPISTANPVDGDFIVTLDKWNLGGTILLKTLGDEVVLPEGANLIADSNLTTGKLTGNVTIPEFRSTVSVLYIPTSVGLTISEAEPVDGVVSLSREGILDISAVQKNDVTITSLAYIPVGQCKTVEPAVFPLTFQGPVSALGSGDLGFDGTTSFSRIRGCFVSAILSTLVSGDGQEFNFNVTPPAPVRY